MKKDIVLLQKKKTDVRVAKSWNSIATKFLESVSEIRNSATSDMDSSFSRKRSITKSIEGNTDSIISQSSSKRTITIDDDGDSISSLDTPSKSIETRSSVS